jgi:hypothetical protein
MGRAYAIPLARDCQWYIPSGTGMKVILEGFIITLVAIPSLDPSQLWVVIPLSHSSQLSVVPFPNPLRFYTDIYILFNSHTID